MTFELKEFNELNELFTNIKDVLRKRYKLETIEQIGEPRKSQIKFIEYAIDTLIQQNKHPRLANPKKQAGILFAAMSLISTMIDESLVKIKLASYTVLDVQGSQLRDLLNTGLGLTENEKPSAKQSFECYKALNFFLKRIFTLSDSRNGIDAQNPFRFIDPTDLEHIMTQSYKKEMLSAQEFIASYESNEQSKATPANYRLAQATPLNCLAAFKKPNSTWDANWTALVDEITSLNNSEVAKHTVGGIEKLSKERATQLGFLHELIAILNKIPAQSLASSEKIAILAGAMYLVRAQINLEYKKSPLSTAEHRSLVHTELSALLKANSATPEDIEVMLTAAQNFISYVTVASDAIIKEHPFSKIAHFDLKALMGLTLTCRNACRLKALDTVMKSYKAALKAEKEALDAEKEDALAPQGYSMAGLLGGLSSLFRIPTGVAPKAVNAKKEIEQGAAEVEVLVHDADALAAASKKAQIH